MRTSLFEYNLPQELIAQEPVQPRDASRLMVVKRETEEIEHRIFRDLPEYLETGDILVLNNTRVMPSRLFSKRRTGGKVEILLLRRQGTYWEALVNPGRKARVGEILEISPRLKVEIVERGKEGIRLVKLHCNGDLFSEIKRVGKLPLPPYIKKPLSEPSLYQTIYAEREGSAAAPTAGLHFTQALFKRLEKKGVKKVFVTLHIGLDTFRPIKEEEVEEHSIHTEYYEVPSHAAEEINRAKREKKKVVAVGTTSVRVIETVAEKGSRRVLPGRGFTDLYIYPGYKFKVVDALITNFHLPRTTLIVLVSAFAGRKLILRAYKEAIENRYRFYSFGDAMLIL
jgi:S-adenosylmethionine:tRNA ribosyltransferase-isomerase